MAQTPISNAIFVNLCKTQNDHFEKWVSSSTATLRTKFAAFNLGVRGANNRTAELAVNTALDALKNDKATKDAKYTLALDYVAFCLEKRAARVNYTRSASGAGVIVKKDGAEALKFKPGTPNPPVSVPNESLTHADGKAMLAVATDAIRITRSILWRGTLNNETYLDDRGQTPAISRISPSSLDPGRDVMAGGATTYFCDRPGLRDEDRDAPKYLMDFNDNLEPFLRGDNDQDIALSMAAKAYGPWNTGGAVCSMCAHVAAGVLTMLSPPGTRINIAFDSAFDHSYVVIQKGLSPWITVDPWPGHAWAMPWKPNCWFPPDACSSNFIIEVTSPVSVPYGIPFAADVVQNAWTRSTAMTKDWRAVPEKPKPVEVPIEIPEEIRGNELQKNLYLREQRRLRGVQAVTNEEVLPPGDPGRRAYPPKRVVCDCLHQHPHVHTKATCPRGRIDNAKWVGCKKCASGCKLHTTLGVEIAPKVKQCQSHYFHPTNLGPPNVPKTRTEGVRLGYVLAADFGDWGPIVPTP
jgi:hypothetical protein